MSSIKKQVLSIKYKFAWVSTCFILSLCFLFLNTSPVNAVMRSDNYELQMPNLNFSAGNVSSSNYKLGFTGGQTGNGPYNSTGYRVLAGFWYLKTIIPFSFSISNTVIEFGTLTSGLPSTANTDITVSAGGAGGYQVTVQEDHQMSVHSIGAIISDTTGDSGDITESSANAWALNTTYGFGYTMFGNDVPAPFPTAGPAGTTYKQFADISKNETPQTIMLNSAVGKNRRATLTYKINTSAIQVAGRYHNVITFIATPLF